MSTETTNSRGSDILITVAVVACLALGAGMTWWLTRSTQISNAPVAPVQVRGERMNAAPSPQPAAAAAGNEKAESKTAAVAAPPPAPSGNSDYVDTSFNTLSGYYYEIPDIEEAAKPEKSKDQIPAPVRNLNGKKVAIQGFMIPTTLEKGMVTTFLLVKDQSVCCFGRVPRMNEWVAVSMQPGKSVRHINDQPVTVFGKIEVGELIEKGELLNIYRLEAEDVAGPLDL